MYWKKRIVLGIKCTLKICVSILFLKGFFQHSLIYINVLKLHFSDILLLFGRYTIWTVYVYELFAQFVPSLNRKLYNLLFSIMSIISIWEWLAIASSCSYICVIWMENVFYKGPLFSTHHSGLKIHAKQIGTIACKT